MQLLYFIVNASRYTCNIMQLLAWPTIATDVRLRIENIKSNALHCVKLLFNKIQVVTYWPLSCAAIISPWHSHYTIHSELVRARRTIILLVLVAWYMISCGIRSTGKIGNSFTSRTARPKFSASLHARIRESHSQNNTCHLLRIV